MVDGIRAMRGKLLTVDHGRRTGRSMPSAVYHLLVQLSRNSGDSCLHVAQLQHAFGDVLGAEPESAHQVPGLPGKSETVVHTQHIEEERMFIVLAMSQNGSGDDVAKSAHLVLFRREDDLG